MPNHNTAGWNKLVASRRAVSASMQIKHSQLEHSDHKEPCCIGVRANQNTANWNTVITNSPAVLV